MMNVSLIQKKNLTAEIEMKIILILLTLSLISCATIPRIYEKSDEIIEDSAFHLSISKEAHPERNNQIKKESENVQK